MASKRFPRIQTRLVEAIRKRALEGSTPREICNYISEEYDVPAADVKRPVRLALARGVSYGILQHLKGGRYAYKQDFLDGSTPSGGTGDARVDIRCSKRRSRRGRRSRSRKRRRVRSRKSGRRSRIKRSREPRRRSRRRRSRRRSRRRLSRRKRRAVVPKEIEGPELKALTKQPDASDSLSSKENLRDEGSAVYGYPQANDPPREGQLARETENKCSWQSCVW